jgi:serine/threonine protein phosphatase PrpC
MNDVRTLRHAALSDRGLVRPENEDAVFAGPNLLAVADGIGGAAAGEVASALAISAVAPLDSATHTDPAAALRAAVMHANQLIADAIEEDSARTGMGTTLTAVLLTGESMLLAHAGDSRAYVLSSGEVTRITRDDTYVQWLVDEGCISEEEAGTHPHRSVVTRVLTGAPVEPTFEEHPARPGDRYLVCSDGLPAAVSEEVIAAVLRDEAGVQACAARLVELAMAGGAPDNVTVVVADVTGGSEDNAEQDDPAVGVAAVPADPA